MPSDLELRTLLGVLDRAYNRRSWHGTNLRGSIRGLTVAQALWRPQSGRHNIWEIVVHAAYWKYAVMRRLTGERRGSFPLKGSNWFPREEPGSELAWKNDVTLLDAMHTALRRAIESTSTQALHSRDGEQVTNVDLIAGVAAHDLYHAGQIQLLKRFRATKHADNSRGAKAT